MHLFLLSLRKTYGNTDHRSKLYTERLTCMKLLWLKGSKIWEFSD
jgi:hypothetical protein